MRIKYIVACKTNTKWVLRWQKVVCNGYISGNGQLFYTSKNEVGLWKKQQLLKTLLNNNINSVSIYSKLFWYIMYAMSDKINEWDILISSVSLRTRLVSRRGKRDTAIIQKKLSQKPLLLNLNWKHQHEFIRSLTNTYFCLLYPLKRLRKKRPAQ